MAHTTYRLFPGQRDNAQVLIVDLNSKSTPLIAQILREIGIYSDIIRIDELPGKLTKHTPRLLILSGGPDSVYDRDSLQVPNLLLSYLADNRGVFILGICYGAQLLAHQFGGKVEKAAHLESGLTTLALLPSVGFGDYLGGPVVMNHGDEIISLPFGWRRCGSTPACTFAFFGDRRERMFGVQFHPEMDHTMGGDKLFSHLCYSKAGCVRDYEFNPEGFVREAWGFIQTCFMAKPQIGKRILCAFSGGVDSSVAFQLALQALGRELVIGVYVDNGFMRTDEAERLKKLFSSDPISYLRAGHQFYAAVGAISYRGDGDEQRYFDEVRRAIGETFASVFAEFAGASGNIGFLLQGTNAADIVETVTGLKRHHNVGGLPDQMDLDVIEPLAGLYKTEIRQLALFLGLPEEVAWAQPFPGPGFALRTGAPITQERVEVTAHANVILEQIIGKYYPHFPSRPCQYYVALIPFRTCGLIGDKTVFGYTWQVRAVTFNTRESYTTLRRFDFPPHVWDEITWRLVNETQMSDGTRFVRVTGEMTGRPPSTTELY